MRPDARGFTLLEILVALAILSGTLVLAFRVISGGVSAQTRSEEWVHATLLGEAQLRRTMEQFPETGDTDGTFAAPDDAFRWRQTVVQALHKDAREVHLTVTWSSQGEEERVAISGLAVR
jgi:general secretion pathway protein I